MLVCKINKVIKKLHAVYYFYVKTLFDSQGTTNCSVHCNSNVLLIVLKYMLKVLGMYLSTFSLN